MTIDQLKTTWQQYEHRLQLSQQVNEQLIRNILKERSRSRVSWIRKKNAAYLVIMILELVLLTAIFTGNPFDFVYDWQYLPFGLLAAGVLLVIASLVKSLVFFKAGLLRANLDDFLKSTIKALEQSRRAAYWLRLLVFLAGILTIFSFLPGKLESKSMMQALAETGLLMAVAMAVYAGACKLGAFEDRDKEGFESDREELQKLIAIESELSEERLPEKY
ncbi:MAG TPA: hypothetical protein VFR58_16330 [Flavisolibacter sp.]|nr:hypothetical protein [Flavisolibacter sp.]